METENQREVFLGRLVRGDLRGAMELIRQSPEHSGLYQKYVSRFEEENYEVFEEDDTLNKILLIYQKYYRDVFYLNMEPEQAEKAMERRFRELLGGADEAPDFSELESGPIAREFEKRSYHFLGGLTSGYWGPYIWKDTQTKRYDVELPDGVRGYTLKLLDGFISLSWLHYISFGITGTGGWTGADGTIHCVRDSYDLDSENFQVSLLKHEAQHGADLAVWPDMSSEDLEYRAKLVELIYSSQRDLLPKFRNQAGCGSPKNGHAAAADRIVSGFAARLGGKAPDGLPIEKVQAVSRELFQESTEEMQRKYHRKA